MTAETQLLDRLGDTAPVVVDSLKAYGENTGLWQVAHNGARLTVHIEHLFDAATRTNRNSMRYSRTATVVEGGGNRANPEEADPWRSCFERDRDRIRYSPAFRRLAHKCQVFIAPTDDHLRTRLTHALEVAQVAVAVSAALGLNTALTEAIALGHDCGHGPAGHSSEEAFAAYLEGGYDHAPWGADVVLAPHNLCEETLDGIRNHSWRLAAPGTPEAEIVAWADRIAYVCHDFDDALRAKIVTQATLGKDLGATIGSTQSRQIGTFINALVESSAEAGYVAMDHMHAEALATFRKINYEHIYLREESRDQAKKVIRLLSALVEYHAEHIKTVPDAVERIGRRWEPEHLKRGTEAARFAAVHYVSSMTDRYALQQGIELLGMKVHMLPEAAG